MRDSRQQEGSTSDGWMKGSLMWKTGSHEAVPTRRPQGRELKGSAWTRHPGKALGRACGEEVGLGIGFDSCTSLGSSEGSDIIRVERQ